MQTQVAKLRRVLSLLEPAVSRKPTLKALSYVRLGEGKAVATDLDVTVMVDLPETQDGVCLLPFAVVENFLRFTPGSLALGIVSRDGKVHLLTQGSEASFPTMDPEEYPPLLAIGEDARSAVVDGDDLVKALAAMAGYTATQQDRPVLTAVCLALEEPMEAAAADGFRLAVRTLRSGFPGGEGQRALVPRAAVKVLERLWKLAPPGAEAPEDAPIAELVVARRPVWLDYDGEAHVLRMRFGEVTLMARLVEGTFPAYQELVPTSHTSRVTFHAEELLRAVRQVGAVAREGTGVVRLQWEALRQALRHELRTNAQGEEGRLTVAAKAEEVGDVEVGLRADIEAPGRSAFNVKYLMEATAEGDVREPQSNDTPPEEAKPKRKGRRRKKQE